MLAKQPPKTRALGRGERDGTMRQPTSISERWEWWERALAGDHLPFYEDKIHCGYFKIRKFPYGQWPKGPFIPARIWMEPGEIDPESGELLSDERWFAEIDGQRKDPWRTWTWLATRPITEDEFKWLTALSPLLPKKLPQKFGAPKA